MATQLWAAALQLVAAGFAASAVQAQTITAPRLLAGQLLEPTYPSHGSAARARVLFELAIDATGAVSTLHVLETQLEPPETEPAPFIEAATLHTRSLRFEPATRDGLAIAAVIRFQSIIAPPPALASEPAPAPPPPPAADSVLAPDAVKSNPPAAVSSKAETLPPAFSATAHAKNGPGHERSVAASDLDIEIGALRSVPRRDAQSYLTLAPGVVLANHAGTGHASGMFLRGFDAGEGQDVEFSVDGVPINEPSNAHGHGYADTQFVIPELIAHVRVLEGPFDPRQSDFAVAGSVGYQLGVADRGLRAQIGYGSNAEQRGLLLWAPTGASRGTFAAVDLRKGDGFGPNRAHASFSALGRYETDSGPVRYTLLLASHALRYDSAGVIRADDYAARELPCAKNDDAQFFCTEDPHQGGSAQRQLLSGKLNWQRPGRRFTLQTFGMRRGLHIREDFTGVLLDPRGDGLDEGYEATTLGANAAYVATPTFLGRTHRFEVGLQARHDAVDTRSWRLRGDDAVPYQTVFDNRLALTHLGAYARAELRALSFLRLIGGARLDAFGFGNTNLNAPASDRIGPRLPVDRRDAWGTALSPRGSLVITLAPPLEWSVSAGLGVRSADAQALSDGERAPFARVCSLESGPTLTLQPDPAVRLEARAFGFATRVENDLLFDAVNGRNLPVGPSNRYGASAMLRSRIERQHDSLLSLSVSEARKTSDRASLLSLGSGPLLAFVPRFVLRFDHASIARVQLGSEPALIGAALGLSYVGPRPLPLGTVSDAVWQLDLSVRARVRFIELSVSLENLFDRRNRVAEFNYASSFPNDDAPASMRAARHFAAGAPRTFWLALTAYFDDIQLEAGDRS